MSSRSRGRASRARLRKACRPRSICATRCAAAYDIYVSLKPTGEGAILLKTVKASGELVNGFLADTDNYAFVVWRDGKGGVSKPSAPFKFRLKDEFPEK